MWREARGQKAIATRETRSIKQPGQKECTVRVRRERDGVQNDGSGDAALLADCDVRAFEASAHATSTKTALGDLPKTVSHCVKNEVVRRLPKSEAASTGTSLIMDSNIRDEWALTE